MSAHLESSRHSPAPRNACKSALVQPQRGCGFRPGVDAQRLQARSEVLDRPVGAGG
jgi:hypothetical protein